MPYGILMGNDTKYLLNINHTVLTLSPKLVTPHNTTATKLTEEIKTFLVQFFQG